jgi:hypothetical protein
MDGTALIGDARRRATGLVARPGDWLSGAERVAVWREVRAAATDPLDLARRDAISPSAVGGGHHARPPLDAADVEVVHRVASDPGRLTRAWAEASMAEQGEERYVELVAVTAIVSVLDWFDRAIGGPLPPLPTPVTGDPARVRPDGVGDVGAWVAQSVRPGRANVSRALSLVPVTEAPWAQLVSSHYSRGAEFLELRWERNLSRPQVELVAARTTALNECFY